MKFFTFYEPCAHVIIEDFLDDQTNKNFVDLAKKLKPYAGPNKTYNPIGDQYIIKHSDVSNMNIWLGELKECKDELLVNKSIELTNVLEKRIWETDIREIFYSMNDSLFKMYQLSNYSSFLLSWYEKNDYFKYHADDISSITGNYLFNDNIIEGGDFCLAHIPAAHDKSTKKGGEKFKNSIKRIPFKNNSIIFFPGAAFHGVSEILLGTRFSIQYWASCFTSHDRGVAENTKLGGFGDIARALDSNE